MPVKAKPFWSKVKRGSASECWPWLGAKFANGYGAQTVNRKSVRAHRVAYESVHGPIPNGLVVRHSCDTRECCNPEHLVIGTQRDNVNDREERGRGAKGERISTAKLTMDQVRAIRTDSRLNRVIAESFGVSKSMVGNIKRGEAWRHGS